MNEDLLVERMTNAERPRHPANVVAHPAFHDLSEEGRERAYELTRALRTLEAALDPRGLSTTAHAVLARIRRP